MSVGEEIQLLILLPFYCYSTADSTAILLLALLPSILWPFYRHSTADFTADSAANFTISVDVAMLCMDPQAASVDIIMAQVPPPPACFYPLHRSFHQLPQYHTLPWKLYVPWPSMPLQAMGDSHAGPDVHVHVRTCMNE